MARTSGKAAGRSTSRGRPPGKAPKSPKTPAKTPTKTPIKVEVKSPKPAAAKKVSAKAPVTKMDYTEGNHVMARWPGTSLFFKAKVTFVRDDDNEYDVQYEDGTVFTVKSKDVKSITKLEAAAARKKTPSRSRSRGWAQEAPRRKPKASPARSPKTKEAPSPRSSRRSAPVAVKAPKPEATPTRASARLAMSKVELSSDEDDGPKAIPNPDHPRRSRKGFFGSLNFDWLQALFFMVLGPLILVSLHTLCKEGKCVLAIPQLPKKVADYWNQEAFAAVLGFTLVLRFLSFIPLGSRVKAVSGSEVRLNGFFSLFAILSILPALVYRKVDLSFISKHYWHLMVSSLLFSFVLSALAFVLSRWGKRGNANPKGNSGNIIVDFFNGREFNPFFAGFDLKLQTFRMSMIGLAVINVVLVLDSVVKNNGTVNPAVVMAAAFQVLYALDAMFFEEYYFFSHDAMNTGFGFSLASSYFSFPFIPTLVTRYMIAKNPTLSALHLTGIFVVNAVGYLVFRMSESQRCEFAKNPSQQSLRNLETISTVGGKKLLCGGFWALVRHPNYLGEILVQWSWVLPAVKVAGLHDVLIYYLPIFTTLMLLVRCKEQNTRNKRKYGSAWDQYTQRVKSNIVPYLY